jgi:hypothetical protein
MILHYCRDFVAYNFQTGEKKKLLTKYATVTQKVLLFIDEHAKLL